MKASQGVLLLGFTLVSACLGRVTETHRPTDPSLASASAYLVSHGWHVGLAVRREDIPAGTWPESQDFPSADYLEVGWGDRDYYQALDPGIWLALKAALWPTPGVLHVVGLHGSVSDNFPDSEKLELPLPRSGLESLMAYVHGSYDRMGQARAAPLGPGLYGHSRFYPGRGQFHLFNTCNVWVAHALNAAGYPLSAVRSITAGGLMAQARKFRRAKDGKPVSQ